MSAWLCILIFTILASLILIIGWEARRREDPREVTRDDPCDGCLRWPECNGEEEMDDEDT